MKYLMIILSLSVCSFLTAQQKFTYKYTTFCILKNNDLGEILKTDVTVDFDFLRKIIKINKPNNEGELYWISSKQELGKTSSGNNYMTVVANNGTYDFYLMFFEKKLMVINKLTKNGIVFHK